ncbi:MAG: hypothetical protein R3257_02335 [bacterium]|nr:hypothetical protein [bacterium]
MRLRNILILLSLVFLPLGTLLSCAGTPVALIAIQLNPLCVQDVQPSDQIQFNACVFIDGVRQPGFENSAVTWSVLGGDVNGTVTQDGLYTAPSTTPPPAGQVIVIATSTEDDQKQGQSTVVFVGQGTCETFETEECK